jgi:hypothetical protein
LDCVGANRHKLDGFRVLALGGSTTENLYSDTEHSWPGQLELLLTKRYPRLHPWVGNAGRSSQASIHLALHVEHLPSGLPPLDAIVIFLGVTDLALATCWSAPCDYPRELIEQIAFSLRPNPNARFYERPMLYRLARRWIEYIKKRGAVQTVDGAWMTELRLLRAQAEQLIDEPRDLSHYINSEMKPNLRRIANSAGRQGIPLILVTQTVMWKPNQTAEEDAILFVGGAGYYGDYVQRKVPLVYFTAGALRVMMEQINAATLEICRETKTVCVHASPEISGRLEYFYDDCHMSDAGFERLAQLILPAITEPVPEI